MSSQPPSQPPSQPSSLAPENPAAPAPTLRLDPQSPKWVREIHRFLGVKSQFVLWGNIHDVYPIVTQNKISVGTLVNYLKHILASAGYEFFFRYEPFELLPVLGDPRNFNSELPQPKDVVTLEKLAQAARTVTASPQPAALMISYGSRLTELCTQELAQFQYELFRLSVTGKAQEGRFNLIFLIMDKENDLPPWYSLDNPRVRVLPIPRPDHGIRRYIVRAVGPLIKEYKDLAVRDPVQHQALVNRFIDQTSGLFASELISVASLAAQDGLPFPRITEAVRHYKLGVADNPWSKLDHSVIRDGFSRLSAQVIGQKRAVRHSLDIIKRSIFDLSGAQFSPHGQRPKGVLFFAGPTGVGKTELAKSLTELVFGSPENYIRFDMSEFNQPHSDQRLVGAPPGYVGYDVGGELTNAIKQRPFTLILFDEIEKAHPKIMDIFLQILDDGRLTSGRGETVYFSDAVLVFTSNLGVYGDLPGGGREELVNPDMTYAEVSQTITGAIFDFFRFQLNRPEILNRIGQNIVVFDFIRPDQALSIFRKMLDNVLAKLKTSHSIDLTVSQESLPVLAGLVTKDLSMGGRGIGNALETWFVNPLSRELFEIDAAAGRYICRILADDQDTVRLKVSPAD
ncbi:MAG: AAA family ATPase [Deltaproteobacteria bacterium]|jgi:energy-coupling factor transporter ATP-binding protein EcfA2|nr:AAA family ATPase [Deltaproteobacteria bacterium]